MSTSRCAVTESPIDAATLLAETIGPEDGAGILFVGVVRNHNDGREVNHLDYDAYVAMAEHTLEAIVTEALAKWETGEIRVIHRIGRLEIGEASVAIAVAASHRGGAYEASRYIIEELKRRAPIWKREGYVAGDSEWLTGLQPGTAASHE